MKIRDRIKELRRVKASELIPNPKNWRTHPEAQQNAMRGILAEVGIADAVLARETPDGLMLIEDMRVAERADHLRRIPAAVRFISYEPALGPLHDINLDGIDWVIQGGESGSGYRDMPHQWARDMRDKCDKCDVAYFFKQSAAYRTELGIELDGEIVRKFPVPRTMALIE